MNDFMYGCLKALLFAVSRIPMRTGYLLSRVVYLVLAHVARYRKGTILANLHMAFPEKSEAEIVEITRKYYRHLAELFVEIACALYIPKRELDRRVRFLNPELVDGYYDEGRHIVGVTSHYANWEWGYCFQLHCRHRIAEVYKRMSGRVSERLFRDIRSRFGGLPVEMGNLKPLFFEASRNPVLVYLVADQSPAGNEKSWYFTSFMGIDGTPVFTGPEKIARKLDAVFLYVDMRKNGCGRYSIEFSTLCEHSREMPENSLIDMYLRKTEEVIRNKPEYWMWSHRRWKRRREIKN